MKQLRRDNTGAGPRRCRSPPIVTTVVEGERRSPGSSSWRSSIRELPSLSQAGTGSRTMAPRGWRQRRKALWSGEAIVTNFEGAEKSDRLEKSSISEIVRGGLPGLGGLFSCNHDDRQGVQESERRGHGSTSRARCVSRPLVADTSRHGVKTTVNTTPLSTATTPPLFSLRSSRLSLL